MYLNLTVKIPEQETGISMKTIKGTTYVYYEHGRKYYADRKWILRCGGAAVPVWREPPVRNGLSHRKLLFAL